MPSCWIRSASPSVLLEASATRLEKATGRTTMVRILQGRWNSASVSAFSPVEVLKVRERRRDHQSLGRSRKITDKLPDTLTQGFGRNHLALSEMHRSLKP